jgi:L-asparaginase II
LECEITTESSTTHSSGAAGGGMEGSGTASPVLAEVVRSGFVESRHRGSAVALAADGRPVLQAGVTGTPMFPRSANKPLQAAAMLRCGLDLEGKLLALAAASHSGEDFHVAGVREILAGAGLGEDALRCPAAFPMDERTLHKLLRSGGQASRVRMNCSGKHAAMLAACVAAGWPAGSYLSPDHPLQQAIRRTVGTLAGEPVAMAGVDGCGAPLFALTIAGLARAFRALIRAQPGSAEREVADAMRTHPDWTSGTTRPERLLMDAVPGLLVKSGAEGVQAFALPDGRAGVLKIDDGSSRPVTPVTVALLRWLGADRQQGTDRGVLDGLASTPVMGGDAVVGEIRATLPALPPTGTGFDGERDCRLLAACNCKHRE